MVTRVAIVTLIDNTNYGNVLQNYALQKVISGLGGTTVATLQGAPVVEPRQVRFNRRARTFATPSGITRLPVALASRLSGAPPSASGARFSPTPGQAAIAAFATCHIRTDAVTLPHMIGSGTAQAAYDYFVVGSDQVWNPDFTHGNPEWFLSFAPPERRIAYAGSFGTAQIPGYSRRRYATGLRSIPKLSVREHQAAAIVSELTGLAPPPVVLDPTLLLPQDAWERLAAQPPDLAGRQYVLSFLLANSDSQAQAVQPPPDEQVKRLAKGIQTPIVTLPDPRHPDHGGLGPEAFLGAIRGAKLVCTDSYHAAVFALIFKRPFVLIGRGGMNSRLDTLMRHAGLPRPRLEVPVDARPAPEINWDAVGARLARLREQSLRFLSEALPGPACKA